MSPCRGINLKDQISPQFLDSKRSQDILIAQNQENDPFAIPRMLNTQGIRLFNEGKYEQAIMMIEKALSMTREIFGDKHLYTATIINNLGSVYHQIGAYDRAENLYQESLNIRKELVEENHISLARSYNNLATLYSDQGDYQRAKPLFQQALSIFQENQGNQHPETLTIINNLAILHQELEDYQQAESFFYIALATRMEILGINHPETLQTLNDLGTLYRIQGNYADAEEIMQQALEIARELFDETDYQLAIVLNNLALLRTNQNYYQEAESLYEQALNITRQVLGNNHDRTASLLNNLGMNYVYQGKYPPAQQALTEAVTILEQVFGEKHPSVGVTLNNLGLLHTRQGNFQEAELVHTKSLELSREIFGHRHIQTRNSLHNLAGLYWADNRLPLAVDYLTQSMDIEEEKISYFLHNIGDESRKQAYMESLYISTNWAMDLHLNFMADDHRARELAINTILRRKGRVLDVVSNMMATLQNSENPTIEALFEDLAQRRSELALMTFQGVGEGNLRLYQERVNRLELEIRSLETDLSNLSAEFEMINQEIDWQGVQKKIPDGALLLEYMVYTPFDVESHGWKSTRYGVYVMGNDGLPQGIDLGETQEIDELISQWRDYLGWATFHGDEELLRQEMLAELAPRLYELIFEPLLPWMEGNEQILIAPDSQLNLIPFAALQDGEGRYLLEDYSISYLTSGRDLLRLQNQWESQSPAVMVGNPSYDLHSPDGLIFRGGSGQRSFDLRGLAGCCEALPGTAEEVRAIAPLFENVRIYVEDEALAKNIVNVQGPEILHLATHGFFLPDVSMELPDNLGFGNEQTPISGTENPLLRSGLAFAGFNPATNQLEGALTALDISSLNLWGTQLVTLSACQTGVGEVRNGEGVYGLRRALVLAGAQTQVMSLWNVDDMATKHLMVNYYQRLSNGEGRSQALRQVQLEMLNSPNYNSPYYWSAFTLSGNWHNVPSSSEI